MIKEGKIDFYVLIKEKLKVCDILEKVIEVVKKLIEWLGVFKINFYYVWNIRKMEYYELVMRFGG